MKIFISKEHGCAYRLDDNVLLQTPMYVGGGIETADDNWSEVDEMALLGEEQSVQDYMSYVIQTLSN